MSVERLYLQQLCWALLVHSRVPPVWIRVSWNVLYLHMTYQDQVQLQLCWFIYCQQALHGKLRIFLNARKAAQFLNPTQRDTQMCLWCLFSLESGLRMQPTREQCCLGRGEAEYKGRTWSQSATKLISVSVRTWTTLTCQGTDWDSSQCYRARGIGTVHHNTKQNQLFGRSPILRQLGLILLVNKGCIAPFPAFGLIIQRAFYQRHFD